MNFVNNSIISCTNRTNFFKRYNSVSRVDISAGYNGIIDEVRTGNKVDIPLSALGNKNPDDYFVLYVKGNSMYPKLIEGDRILCLRCNSVDSGDLAVVLYNGDEATVKKVHYVYGEDWLELIPINPEYPPKRIEKL